HQRPNPPEVIMLTGHATVESAIEAMKLGAYDYLSKPYRIAELDALVKQAAEKRRLRVDNARLRTLVERQTATPEIVFVSEGMREVMRLVDRVAPSDASVLITGESGTGKELVAQAIHRLSPRSEGSFIDLNCAAFQESLLESELFGYEAGAFSGAKGRKLGLWELADNGTIFLDEITELPPQLQSKLLRAIETNSFYRVGAVRKVQVDVRVVAATNRDIAEVTADGRFRAKSSAPRLPSAPPPRRTLQALPARDSPRALSRRCARSSASRFSPRWSRRAGTAARPRRFSASRPRRSTGVCATTI